MPDLIIEDIDMNSIRIDCPSGQGSCRTEVELTVANTGLAGSGPSKLRVTIDPRQSQSVLENVPAIPAGGMKTLRVTFPPGRNCFDPDCTVCAIADATTDVAESDETNNALCRTRGG